MKFFAVFDSKAATFLPPFLQRTHQEAQRNFLDESLRDGVVGRHPADFTLFELGEYEQTSGRITPHDAPIAHGTALQLQAAAQAKAPEAFVNRGGAIGPRAIAEEVSN